MNNIKKIIFSLLAITSFSLISVGAQAGGISISIGGHSHGYFPLNYYGHNYKPYYGYKDQRHSKHHRKHHHGHHQSYVNHNNHGSRYDSQRHHNRRDQHRSNNHNSNHGNSRIASNMRHR